MRQEALSRWLGAAAMLGLVTTGGPAARAEARAPRHKPTPEAAASSAEAGFDNVEVTDPGLEGKLSILRVGSDRTTTNLLSIFATLKNMTSGPLKIEVQTLYKNGNGDWLDGGKAGWVELELKPHEELEYRSASLSDEAQDFLVRVRRPATAE